MRACSAHLRLRGATRVLSRVQAMTSRLARTAARRQVRLRRAANRDGRAGLGLAAHQRQPDRAVRGGEDRAAKASHGALAETQLGAGLAGSERRRPRRWRLGLPL